MPNVVLPNEILAGQDVLATPVSDNFQAFLNVVNSNGLDGTNYGLLSVLAANIASNAVISDKIAPSAVTVGKIADGAITHDKLNFASSDGGVRVVQLGEDSTDLPAGGFSMVRMRKIFNVTTQDVTFNFTYSTDGVDGNPNFVSTPVVAGWGVHVAASTDDGPRIFQIGNANSDIMPVVMKFLAVAVQTVTVDMVVIGELG